MTNRQANIALTVILGITLSFTLLGIMFGHHWDEAKLMNSARQSFQSGNLLPGWYAYPSLPHDLATLVQLSKHFSFIYPGFEEPWKQHLMVRGVFILYSCTGIVFTFLLTRLLTFSNAYSLLAAAFLAFSWEFGYHIRWIAPDSIMMANVIGCVYFSVKYFYNHNKKYLGLACLFGGLALGSKYPAGLVFLPLLLSVYFVSRHGSDSFIQAFLKQGSIVLGLTSFVFIATTPGFLLEFEKAIEDVMYEIAHYQKGHLGHTLENVPFVHFYRLLEYFALASFSSAKYLSVLSFLLVLPGIYHVGRFQEKSVIFIWLSFPVAYILFFSFQKVFIVRNYQVLLPFVFTLASVGLQHLLASKPRWVNPLKFISILVVASVIGYNLFFSFKAAFSILNYSGDKLVIELHDYIKNHRDTRFYISKTIKKDYKKKGLRFPDNVLLTDSLPAKGSFKVATYNPKKEFRHFWQAYHHDYVDKVFGSMEVNFNYYPNWAGYQKIVILFKARYREIRQKQDATNKP